MNNIITPHIPVWEINFDKIDWFDYPVYLRNKILRGAVSMEENAQQSTNQLMMQNVESNGV
jgi:hypothetical protein